MKLSFCALRMRESGGRSYSIFEILTSEVQPTSTYFLLILFGHANFGVAQLHLIGNQVHVMGIL